MQAGPPVAWRSEALDSAAYQATRVAHWDAIAASGRSIPRPARSYHRRLESIYQFLVPPGLRVLELGCGDGRLLASLRSSEGTGVDFSPAMIASAREQYPDLRFIVSDAHDLGELNSTFDVIVLSDLLHDVWDVQRLLAGLQRLCHPGTRVITNFYSRLWESPLALASRVGLARPVLQQNWLTVADVTNLFHLSNFRVIRSWQEVLSPIDVPLLTPLCNRVLVRFWGIRHLALANFVVARPIGLPAPSERAPTVSVVVPARNEAGNVPAIFA